MLCELSLWGNFATTWAALAVIGGIATLGSSAVVFHVLYAKPTYEKWRHKTNPKYPAPEKVRDEIITMVKGIGPAILCPSLALYLSQTGWSQAYCGVAPHGWPYLAFSFVAFWLGSDLFEWAYHYLGHTVRACWKGHKHHHSFPNPSPFAVVADEVLDQTVRASPLLIFPLLMPSNIDLLFFTYAVFFYTYGIYLHSGHELPWPDAHNPHLNTSFHHYVHHAKSGYGQPYHTGFFFQAWDKLANSVFPGLADKKTCPCVKCSVARGERTREQFALVEKPDYYRVMSRPSFWFGS